MGKTLADDLSRGDVEGREGRDRAMASAIMAAPIHLTGAHSQQRHELVRFRAWIWLFSSTHRTRAR